LRRAAGIAIAEIAEFLSRETRIEAVRCVCFNADSYSAVTEVLAGLR